MEKILDEYRNKFGEQFPMFLARHLSDKELIQLVKDCIESGKPYEPELDENCDY